MYFDLVLPCDALKFPNIPQHVLTCLFIPWHALALLSYNALTNTLNFYGTWEPNQVFPQLQQLDQVTVITYTMPYSPKN